MNRYPQLRVAVRTALLSSAALLVVPAAFAQDQRSARDPWEESSNAIAQGDSEPGYDQPESGGETSVSRRRQRGDDERFRSVPMLRPSREDKRQPMSRDGGVEKRDAEASNGDGGENGILHRVKPQMNTGFTQIINSGLSIRVHPSRRFLRA